MRRGALLLALVLCGCASSSAFRAGQRAERQQDWDRAVLEYSRALRQSPAHAGYRQSLERARVRAAEAHVVAARRLAARGQYKEALDEYRLAQDLNPGALGLADEVRDVEARRQAGAAAVTVEQLKERARERALPGLALGPEAREPLGLSFRNASLREVYQALGRVAGINFVFDPQLQDTPVTLDLRDVGFEQALTAVASVGRTFHRVVDARVVQVIPDTPTKRRDNEQQVVKTFFLSNADLKETIDLLRIVLGARRVAPLPGANALTINDSPDKVAAAERIIDVVDKQRAEVMVDVEILEVNRTRLRDYGIEITSGVGEGGIAGAIFPRTTIEEIVRDVNGNPVFTRPRPLTLDDNPYQASNLLITSLPGVIYRLLKTDGSTRLLANPQLRASEGQTAQARFGDQVPVPVTVFTPIAQGGIAQQPVTSFEYKNVGVNIDITPRVHHDGDVTLGLKLEISSLGPLFQNNPTFRSRNLNSVIRLRDGETTLLAGLIQDEERATVTGIPGLGNVPVLGRIFSRNRKEAAETDIVMTMTPHIVRRLELTEEDLRSFSLGSESAPVLFEVPAIPPSAPSPRPDGAPRVEPIRPPAVASPSPLPTP
ncbi:MAG TPA: secretin N-terminal domain-containing protein, partial [Vicinamibacteria bacterium]|nr:secretin N-terminal domain-containing protein [Vicinamibacteria bacterium]